MTTASAVASRDGAMQLRPSVAPVAMTGSAAGASPHSRRSTIARTTLRAKPGVVTTFPPRPERSDGVFRRASVSAMTQRQTAIATTETLSHADIHAASAPRGYPPGRLPHGQREAEAAEVADHLVRANLSGHDSHGVGMLPAYVRLLHDGLLVPNQTAATVLDAGALLVIDARRGYRPAHGGRCGAPRHRRAKENGACVLALRNASHIGRIGTYGELAARAGCVFTAFVNVADHHDIAAPFACAEPRLGTNPFCTAVPGADGYSVMLDMATTTIAAGKARVAYNKGVRGAGGFADRCCRPTHQRSRRIHPRPDRRLADLRAAQGLRHGGAVRDHGGGGGRRAARRRAGAGRHPELDAGDGDRPVEARRSRGDRRGGGGDQGAYPIEQRGARVR